MLCVYLAFMVGEDGEQQTAVETQLHHVVIVQVVGHVLLHDRCTHIRPLAAP